MIIFDLDGTLADCNPRRHFVNPGKLPDMIKWIDPSSGKTHYGTGYIDGRFQPWNPDWQSFYEACDQDWPIKPTLSLLEDIILRNEHFEIWSGRCESVKDQTIRWLTSHIPLIIRGTNGEWDKYLKMRPIGDSTPDYVLKERWLDEAISQGKTIDFVFDSDALNIRMWLRRGIFVFNCCQED